MWTKLLQTMKSNRFLKLLLEDYSKLIDDSRSMYAKILTILHENANVEHAHDFIYETDKRINHGVQNIRRRLIEHLSITGVMDLPAALILISVMKDIERTGDYCKNMYEVALMLQRAEGTDHYWEQIKKLQYDVLPMFEEVKGAFMVSNKERAQGQMDQMRDITERSDALIDELYSTSLSANNAIAFALLTRYCKRVSSHLGNIASAVVVSLPMLDFLDEPKESE